MDILLRRIINWGILKYVTIFIYFIGFVTCAKSQSLSVNSFKLLNTDLTANTAGSIEKDQNGETAALIKVVTTQTGFTFDGGSMGIVKTKQTPGEVWVYIPRGSKKISIKHSQLGVLRDYYFPVAIEAARTYEMILITGEVQTVVKQARTSQYIVFQLTPPNAFVELDGEVLTTNEGTATKMMKFGTYNYRVQAPNYLPESHKLALVLIIMQKYGLMEKRKAKVIGGGTLAQAHMNLKLRSKGIEAPLLHKILLLPQSLKF